MKLKNETLSKNFLIYGFGKSGISSLKYLKQKNKCFIFDDYKKKIIPPRLQAIEGRLIRVPGYVVPLLGDFGGDFETLDEFLLVPVYGMCIHVPPPPPNQVIYVKMNESVEVEKLFDAVWVTGQLQIDVSELPNTENLNYAPEGGFFLTGIEVEVYERDVSN